MFAQKVILACWKLHHCTISGSRRQAGTAGQAAESNTFQNDSVSRPNDYVRATAGHAE